MYLVINKWVIAVKVSNFSCQYLRNHWTLDIGVLSYIGIVWPKEHSPEVWSVPPVTLCILKRKFFMKAFRKHQVFNPSSVEHKYYSISDIHKAWETCNTYEYTIFNETGLITLSGMEIYIIWLWTGPNCVAQYVGFIYHNLVMLIYRKARCERIYLYKDFVRYFMMQLTALIQQTWMQKKQIGKRW